MKEDDAINEAVKFLENYGQFIVERIPPLNDERRPDLIATFGEELYLIEQKTKGDDPDEREREFESLKTEKIIDRAKPLQPRGALSAILRDALQQIEAHPDAPRAFKVVWMTTWGDWRRANTDSLFKGLYGSQYVFDVDNSGQGMKDCYYIGFSDFRRYCEIDAVVVVDGDTLQVLVNEFSPRYDAFIASRLLHAFRQGTHNPRSVVADGDAYSLSDYAGDRRDSEACLAELASRLGVDRMMVMPMNELHVVSNIGN